MNSTITITFAKMNLNEFISFELEEDVSIPNTNNFTIREEWVTARTTRGEIQYTAVSLNYHDAQVFLNHFAIDYNGFNNFIVSRFHNVVTIIAPRRTRFVNWQTNSGTTATIDNSSLITSLSIVNQEAVSHPTETCDKINYNVETNVNCTKYIINGVDVVVNSTNFTIELIRGVLYSIFLVGQDAFDTIPITSFRGGLYYDKLVSTNVVVNVTNFVSGSTVDIRVSNQRNLELEFSIDGINYFDSHVFANQLHGNYTAYVKDQFGCIVQKDFEIDSLGTRKKYFNISKANSINFVKLQEIDCLTVFKNTENSFDKDSLNDFSYCGETFYKKGDPFNIQLKSNYKEVVAKLRKDDLTEQIIPLIQKSDNLSRFMKLDCICYSYNGKLAVYFNSGNTYDEVGLINGDFELNGNTPYFGKINNYVEIENRGTFKINQIIIDRNINKKVLILDNSYSGLTFISKAASIYDVIEYDIYEMNFDTSLFEVGGYDIYIEATYIDDSKIYFLSENIHVYDDVDLNSAAIFYYNNLNNNKDIFYKYGIKHFLRKNYSDIKSYFKDNSELNINDDNVSLNSSELNSGHEFTFEDLTEKEMETLSIALSSENVFINNIGYKKDGALTIDKEDKTNMYKLSINMLKSGKNYSIYENEFESIDSDIIVPSLITTGSKFLKL